MMEEGARICHYLLGAQNVLYEYYLTLTTKL